MVDGNDIAFVGFEPPRNTTVPQTFTFEPAAEDRVAPLAILTGSVHDPAPEPNPSGNQKNRPNFLEVESGGRVTRMADPLGDKEPEWDTGIVDVTIPAGASSLTVRYLSEYDETGDLPASLVWLAAALTVPRQAARPHDDHDHDSPAPHDVHDGRSPGHPDDDGGDGARSTPVHSHHRHRVDFARVGRSRHGGGGGVHPPRLPSTRISRAPLT